MASGFAAEAQGYATLHLLPDPIAYPATFFLIRVGAYHQWALRKRVFLKASHHFYTLYPADLPMHPRTLLASFAEDKAIPATSHIVSHLLYNYLPTLQA